MKEEVSELKDRPENGCYIHGLFLEGSRWDSEAFELSESHPKKLYTDMPVMWLIPTANRKQPEGGIYVCPVYKTLTRAGMSNIILNHHVMALRCRNSLYNWTLHKLCSCCRNSLKETSIPLDQTRCCTSLCSQLLIDKMTPKINKLIAMLIIRHTCIHYILL